MRQPADRENPGEPVGSLMNRNIHRYAQTNVQLFNQLRSEDYSRKEIERVRQAYEFAMSLFTGLFLPSGKTFIDHLVGTASILASLHVPIELVAAGVLHAAYLHGNFKSLRKGNSETKRDQLKHAVGKKVEDYVARYDRMLWGSKTIPVFRDTLDELDAIDRDVLLLRLANELEHNLDLGSLYRENWPQYIERYGSAMVIMAEKLGYPLLSAEMATVFRNIASVQIPMEARIRSTQDSAYLIMPKSYRERFCMVDLPKARRLCSALKDRIRGQLKKYPRIYEVVKGIRTFRWKKSRTRVKQICSGIRYELAKFYRMPLGHICFIGVTGSCGKTTTKELIKAVLTSRYKGRTSKLYNNPDQVAKTLLTVFPWHQFCLHEIGTSEPGLVEKSAKIFRPKIAVVTNISYDHYESFHSLEAIAAEKSKLVEALPADGVAILN